MFSQLPLFQQPSWTVAHLTRYLRQLLESDEILQDVWVAGEVSNFSRPSSGHFYFTLKDAAASLRCVMWRNAATRLAILPRDGDAIEVHGAIGVYEAGGQYQLYADLIRPAGEGLLFQEFLRLKARLEAEGLFDPLRKKPLPRLPQVIGIVTSSTGAALRDMLNTLSRRYPLGRIVLAPSAVQGEEAPEQLIKALQRLNAQIRPDVILLARGGGSIEDLWAFNDERLARAIAASAAPIITGIGHETDFTIADFVADLRAPTPTAAAELATPNRQDLRADLDDAMRRMEQVINAAMDNRRWSLATVQNKLQRYSPAARLRSNRQHLDELARRTGLLVLHKLQLQRAHLGGLAQRLAALNPQAVLNRGYAIVSFPSGVVVHSLTQVYTGDTLGIQVADGRFGARVIAANEKADAGGINASERKPPLGQIPT
jgi:exodeoxyribonuclease VII large subunit